MVGQRKERLGTKFGNSSHRGKHRAGSCYVQIPKESGCGQGQKVRGQEHIQLIAIDYHAATGTAGMGYRGD